MMTDRDSSTPSVAPPKPNTSTRRAVGAWVVRILVFVGMFALISQWQQSGLIDSGDRAPDFEATSVAGESVRLSDFRGKPVILHFWATWCGVCQREFAMLKALHDSIADEAVLLTIVVDDTPDLEQFVEQRGLDYPILRGSRALIEQYKVNAFPTNYFLDAEGIVRSRTVGMTTRLAAQTRLSCAR